MYNLCKLVTNERNTTVLGHPMNMVMQSENFSEIAAEIDKRVRSGCPVNSLLIFKDVEFTVSMDIQCDRKE